MFELFAMLYTWTLQMRFMATLFQILFILMVIFSIIGFITTIKWLFTRKKKETPGEKWRRTGRMD